MPFRRNFLLPLLAVVLATSSVPTMADDGLDAVLAAQPEDVQARYSSRHPAETLRFFGLKPGMTVVEGNGVVIDEWINKWSPLAENAIDKYCSAFGDAGIDMAADAKSACTTFRRSLSVAEN